MNFYDDFIPYSSKAWKQKIQVDLQGADYGKTLLTQTNEGFVITPFYHFDYFEKLEETTKNSTTSKSCNEIEITKEDEARKLAEHFVNKGSKALLFKAKHPFDYKMALQYLLGKNLVFHFKFSFLNAEFIEKLRAFLADEKVFFTVDCIQKLVATGNWYFNFKEDISIVKNQLSQCKENHFLVGVSAAVYQKAGANASQQIAYALAHANEYLTLLNPTELKAISFYFATDTDYFIEIAKLKAFRYLWQLILKEYHTEVKAVILSKPSCQNKAISAKFGLLQNEVAYQSAVLGNADFVITNTEEFHFQNIESSFYIETLAKQLAEKALTIFKTIEKGGGFLQQLKKGTIQQKIKENYLKEQRQWNAKKQLFSDFYLSKDLKKDKKPYNPIKTFVQPLANKSLL